MKIVLASDEKEEKIPRQLSLGKKPDKGEASEGIAGGPHQVVEVFGDGRTMQGDLEAAFMDVQGVKSAEAEPFVHPGATALPVPDGMTHVPQATGTAGGMGRLAETRGRVGGTILRKRALKKPSIKVSQPVVMGSLGKDVIQHVVRRNINRVRGCYERAARKGGDLDLGKLEMRFTIQPTGRVSAAVAAASKPGHAELERCLVAAMESMRFPAPKGGGIIEVRYPFNFQPLGLLDSKDGDDAPLYQKKTVFDFEEYVIAGDLQKPADAPPADPYEGLSFISSQGYFENTYLPGDPQLQWLQRQLEDTLEIDGRPFAAERGSVPYVQPFDPPRSEGLAAYLHADRTAVEGATRMTLQVGLKGSLRHARRRAPLNAALVIDLSELPAEPERRILWSLADAVTADLQAGDRFCLVVAGVQDSLRLTPQRFDAASVRRELARAYEEREAGPRSGDVTVALADAFDAVADQGDDDAPLGAELVLLASAGSLTDAAATLERSLQGWANQGMALTGIGVGADADGEALARLARAGQGRRRLVNDLRGARRVVEEELAASGRVVARAVRLRLRLAEGVKLVRILDSRPLEAHEAEGVRVAEQAIDLEVSESLGIAADRGVDEDGLQTVIPAYYAGDDHVILLDVVVPGPGLVADLQVRYKDLVNLRNSVARSSLSLSSGTRPPGPLCLNVRKNRLAQEVAAALLGASNSLQRQRPARARAALDRAAAAIARLRADAAGLADDPELLRDARMLSEFDRALTDRLALAAEAQTREHLVHSLAFAGRVKLPPGAPR